VLAAATRSLLSLSLSRANKTTNNNQKKNGRRWPPCASPSNLCLCFMFFSCVEQGALAKFYCAIMAQDRKGSVQVACDFLCRLGPGALGSCRQPCLCLPLAGRQHKGTSGLRP
jgi:hypothetical protein